MANFITFMDRYHAMVQASEETTDKFNRTLDQLFDFFLFEALAHETPRSICADVTLTLSADLKLELIPKRFWSPDQQNAEPLLSLKFNRPSPKPSGSASDEDYDNQMSFAQSLSTSDEMMRCKCNHSMSEGNSVTTDGRNDAQSPKLTKVIDASRDTVADGNELKSLNSKPIGQDDKELRCIDVSNVLQKNPTNQNSDPVEQQEPRVAQECPAVQSASTHGYEVIKKAVQSAVLYNRKHLKPKRSFSSDSALLQRSIRFNNSTVGPTTLENRDLMRTSLHAFVTTYVNCIVDGCECILESNQDHNAHLVKVHQVYRYRCPLIGRCSESFKEEYRWAKHISHDHGHVHQWDCTTCGKVFNTGQSLDQHLYMSHYRGRFECVHCSFASNNRLDVLEHYRAVHSDDVEVPTTFGYGKKKDQNNQGTVEKQILLSKLGMSRNSSLESQSKLAVEEKSDFPEKQQIKVELDDNVKEAQSDDESFEAHMQSSDSEFDQQDLLDSASNKRVLEEHQNLFLAKKQKTNSGIESSQEHGIEPTNDKQPLSPIIQKDIFIKDGPKVKQSAPFLVSSTWDAQMGQSTKHYFKTVSIRCFVSECTKTFTSKSQHDFHLFDVHQINRFRCPLIGSCDQSFQEAAIFLQHLSSHYRTMASWPCHACSHKFPRHRDLFDHLFNWHFEGHFTCAEDGCHFEANLRGKVRDHFFQLHRSVTVPVKNSLSFLHPRDQVEAVHKPKQPPVHTNSSATAGVPPTQTVLPKYSILSLKCLSDNCASVFVNCIELNLHLAREHHLLPCLCPASGCARSFANTFKLARHLNLDHHSILHWKCSKCEYVFRDGLQLSGHYYRCHAEGKYKCNSKGCDVEAKCRADIMTHFDQVHLQDTLRRGTKNINFN